MVWSFISASSKHRKCILSLWIHQSLLDHKNLTSCSVVTRFWKSASTVPSHPFEIDWLPAAPIECDWVWSADRSGVVGGPLFWHWVTEALSHCPHQNRNPALPTTICPPLPIQTSDPTPLLFLNKARVLHLWFNVLLFDSKVQIVHVHIWPYFVAPLCMGLF